MGDPSSKPKLPSPRGAQSRAGAEVASVVIMATIFLGFAFAFRGEGGEDPNAEPLLTALPLAIGDLHSAISGVVEAAPDGALEITIHEASPRYPASAVADFARDALLVSRRLRAYYPNIGNKTVRFVAEFPVAPGLGMAEKAIPAIALEFNLSLLFAKVAAPELTPQDFVNQATEVKLLNLSGQRYAGAFCRDEISRSAVDFCRRLGR